MKNCKKKFESCRITVSLTCTSEGEQVTNLKVCLHVPTPSLCPSEFNIVLMMMGNLTGRMGSRPILPVRQPVTIDAIIKLDGDGNGVGDGIGMCKQALTIDCMVDSCQWYEVISVIT